MQKYKVNISLLIAVIMITLSSCEIEDRVIELPEHDSRLVLNAQIYQADTTMNIILTESMGITDTFLRTENIELRNSSQITLFTPDEGAIEGYIYKEPNLTENVKTPFWKFDYNNFLEGETYVIEAEADGYDQVRSEVTIPMPANLVDVEVNLQEADETRFFTRDRFEITIDDPAGEENYYLIEATREIEDNGFFFTRRYRFYDSPENPIDESFLENRISVLSDKNFNGTEYSFVAYGERGSERFSEIKFNIYQITKEAYEYQLAFEKANTDSPFAEPVTFPNNIEAGYGIFSITSKPAIKIIQI